jgi:hypothetical protein
MLVYKKNKNTIHLLVVPIMKCGCVFWEFAKRKLVTRKDKIKIMKTKRYGYATCLPLALSVSGEQGCRGACLLSLRNEDVSIFFGRASVHYEDLLDYWFH